MANSNLQFLRRMTVGQFKKEQGMDQSEKLTLATIKSKISGNTVGLVQIGGVGVGFCSKKITESRIIPENVAISYCVPEGTAPESYDESGFFLLHEASRSDVFASL